MKVYLKHPVFKTMQWDVPDWYRHGDKIEISNFKDIEFIYHHPKWKQLICRYLNEFETPFFLRPNLIVSK